MATLLPDTRVEMPPRYIAELVCPPPESGQLVIAVHLGALKAASSSLTQLVAFNGTEVAWTGAVDERMVVAVPGVVSNARKALWARLLVGPRLWDVVRPGLLTRPAVRRPLLTIYDGDRPWVVVGALEGEALIAAPLNDARWNPKWWTPVLSADQLGFLGSKPSQVELAHLWSLSPTVPTVGAINAGGAEAVSETIGRYL